MRCMAVLAVFLISGASLRCLLIHKESIRYLPTAILSDQLQRIQEMAFTVKYCRCRILSKNI